MVINMHKSLKIRRFFSRIYPKYSKNKAGDTLRQFFQEFGVPERLTFDGSKGQSKPGTDFIKHIRTHSKDYHISDVDLHNQNQAEGFIRELCRKWYCTMIWSHVPRELWDYGIRWV